MRALLPGVFAALCLAAGCANGGFESSSGPTLLGGPPPLPPPGAGSSSGGGGAIPTNPPSLPPTVTAKVAPPPISGGTLAVGLDGTFAVAADPDRDAIYGVDLETRKLVYTVPLHAGDEPGRVVEDAGYQIVHVALRGSGDLLTIDEHTGAIVARRQVCPAPRGVAWEWSTDLVWVACATGELVAFPSRGGAAVHRWVIERDLRDVVFDDQGLAVTSFRAAQILRIGSNGTVTQRYAPQQFPETSAHVMWRAVTTTSGLTLTVHQAESLSLIQTQVQGGYGGGAGGGCSPEVVFASFAYSTPPPGGPIDNIEGDGGSGCPPPIVTAQYTVLDSSGTTRFAAEFAGVLPVDVAISRDGKRVAIAAPGNAYTATLGSYFTATVPSAPNWNADVSPEEQLHDSHTGLDNQPIAVAYDANDEVVLQSREPASLWIETASGPQVISLSSETRRDTGHDVFHTQAGALIACASCHPEGGDDGHVWQLDGNPRRTPSLRGTIAGTAPYHWPGDEPDLVALANDVYTKRMDGSPLDPGQMSALSGWVEKIPAPPAPSWVDANATQRGKQLFFQPAVGCAGCHSGEKLTNNQTMDVGTGGKFQVPPLVGVGWRTPLLHDGCATTIADRFGLCATPQHGAIGSLSAEDISDLGTFLETL